MKKYIELNIKGDENDMALFVMSLKNFESEEFKFNFERKADTVLKGYYLEFLAKRSIDYRSRIVLFVTNKNLRISNIIPKTVSFLEMRQYNSVLRHFYENVICHIDSYNLSVIITKEDNSMEDLISRQAYNALLLWEESCDQNSPTTHPNDKERWMDFICKLFINDDHLILSDFKNWLIEDKGWYYDPSDDEDRRFLDLEIELEFGLDLLAHYAKRR